MIKIKIDENIKNIKNTDIDIKEVRGQENVLWKNLETFDIIVNLSRFYYDENKMVDEFFICAEYNGGEKRQLIIPLPVEKKIKLTDIPCGERVYIYFLMKTHSFPRINFFMNFYYDGNGKEESEQYELMGYPEADIIKSSKKLITNAHKTNIPMEIKLVSY